MNEGASAGENATAVVASTAIMAAQGRSCFLCMLFPPTLNQSHRCRSKVSPPQFWNISHNGTNVEFDVEYRMKQKCRSEISVVWSRQPAGRAKTKWIGNKG